MLSIYCLMNHSLNRSDDVCSIIKGRVPSVDLPSAREQVPTPTRKTRVRLADQQAAQSQPPQREETRPARAPVPDARTPKMTLQKYRSMQRSLRFAQVRVSKQKRIIRQQRLMINDLRKQQQQLGKIDLSLDDVAGRQFILGQLQKRTVRMAARRYSVYDKNFALALHYCSPKCYRFLRKIFVLPTVRSLQRWLENVNISPGFISPVLAMLAVKASRLPVNDRLCTLAFDEMSLKQLVTYNSQADLFEGFVTDGVPAACESMTKPNGAGQSSKTDDFLFDLQEDLNTVPAKANQAMVVLMRGLRCNFKQVIGYFLSANAMSGDCLKNIVLQTVQKVQETGFIPKVIVTDQGSNNVLMRSLLGVSDAQPYIEVNTDKIFFMYDTPHLLKSVRNNFRQHNVEFKGHICKWEDVVDFFSIDSKLTHRLAPKLSKKHIQLPPFTPMRVCLATQTMSSSVSKGILTCIALNVDGIRSSAAYTAEFIEFIDSLFDAFNSCSVHEPKILRRALGENSAHLTFFVEAKTLLANIKFINKSKRNPPCISGWLSNITALEMFWQQVREKYEFKFLFTRRLTQDCLENLFSVVRCKGSNNTNPDSAKFRHILKSVLTNQLLHPSDLSNCDMDCAEFLLAKSEIETKSHTVFPRLSVSPVSVPGTDVLSDSDISANSRTYVTGWVCSRLEHRQCRDAVCSLQQSNEPGAVHISMKKYDDSCKLVYPNTFATNLAAACVTAFHRHFVDFVHASQEGVRRRLKAAVSHEPDLPLCGACHNQFMDRFFNVTIKAFLLRLNEHEVKSKAHKRNKKFQKISHQ